MSQINKRNKQVQQKHDELFELYEGMVRNGDIALSFEDTLIAMIDRAVEDQADADEVMLLNNVLVMRLRASGVVGNHEIGNRKISNWKDISEIIEPRAKDKLRQIPMKKVGIVMVALVLAFGLMIGAAYAFNIDPIFRLLGITRDKVYVMSTTEIPATVIGGYYLDELLALAEIDEHPSIVKSFLNQDEMPREISGKKTIPTNIPTGYSFVSGSVYEVFEQSTTTTVYQDHNMNILCTEVISVWSEEGDKYMITEISPEHSSTIKINGADVIIAENKETNAVVTVVDDTMYRVWGNAEKEELLSVLHDLIGA